MSKPLSHPENRTRQSLNRRQLLRYAAAASAAAAITGRAKARAEVRARDLSFPDDTPDRRARAMRCRRAITLLRQNDPSYDDCEQGMSIGQWIYRPLHENMDWFIKNAGAYHGNPGNVNRNKIDMDSLQQRLKNLRAAIEMTRGSEVYGYSLKIYYGMTWPFPVIEELVTAFEAVDAICASPHVRLDNNQRAAAVALLERDDFQTQLRDVEANDMYQINRNDHLNAHVDPTMYALAREGFEMGIFTEKPSPDATIRYELEDNGKCWSNSEGRCVTGDDDDYCQEDNGQPTTSSDLCSS